MGWWRGEGGGEGCEGRVTVERTQREEHTLGAIDKGEDRALCSLAGIDFWDVTFNLER